MLAGGLIDVALSCLRDDDVARREVRMPFVGTVMAKQSQSFGDVSPKSALPLPDAVKVR